MNELIDQIIKINTSQLLSIASLSLGTLGVFLAIIFYIKSKRFKRLSYEFVNRTLIDDIEKKLEGLTVNYNNTPQPRVTISRFLLWNSGTETIDSRDIASSSPIQLKFDKKISLLDLKIVSTTNESIKFEAGPSASQTSENYFTIPISFEYLDKDDGAVIQLVHTGKKDIKIEVDGKIKGSQGINRLISPAFRSPAFPKPLSRIVGSKFFNWTGAATYLAIGVACSFYLFTDFTTKWGLLFPGVFCFFGGFVMLYMAKARIPASLCNEL